MKSHFPHIVVFAFVLATLPMLAVGQERPGKTDEMSKADAHDLIQRSAAKKQIRTWIASAKTPEDHQRIAAYFNREADRMDDEAKDHEYLADVYRRSPGTSTGGKSGGGSMFRTAEHCESAAKSLREAAKSLRELAAEHEQMAKDAAK